MILKIAEMMKEVGLQNALPTSRVMMGKPIDITYSNFANTAPVKDKVVASAKPGTIGQAWISLNDS